MLIRQYYSAGVNPSKLALCSPLPNILKHGNQHQTESFSEHLLEHCRKHTYIFKKHTHAKKNSVSLSRVAKAICLKSSICNKKTDPKICLPDFVWLRSSRGEKRVDIS